MLEMDPDAPVQSCTSLENPSPNTLQIIIRTHEISLDAQKDAIVDLETEEESMTPFQRMVAIFEKIIRAILNVFEVEEWETIADAELESEVPVCKSKSLLRIFLARVNSR